MSCLLSAGLKRKMQKNSILGHHFLVFRSGGGCTTYEVISIFQVSDFVIFADRNDSRQHQKKKKTFQDHLQYFAKYWSCVTDLNVLPWSV